MKNIFYLKLCSVATVLTLGSLVALAQPKANFAADVTEGCTPLVVKITDLSTGNPTSWKWDLGNGSISTQQDPGIIYITPGTYTIKLIASNASGQDSITKVNYINVYSLPEVAFNASPTFGCAPLNVQFANNSNPGSGSIKEMVWDFGDGQISQNIDPKHLYSFSDTFSVTLSVTNSYGCKKSLQKTNLVKIPSGVKAGFDYTYFNVCQPPAQVDFNNRSVSNSSLTHSWNFGDGTSSTNASPNHTFTNGGDYTIQLVTKTENGCVDTFSRKISIGSVKADFKVADSVCTNQPLFFENMSNPLPANVSWDFGNGKTSDEIDAYQTFTAPGTYKVVMSADFGSCNGSVTKVITVTNRPKPSFTSNSKLISCALPLSVTFNNTSNGAVTYKWIFGDGQVSSSLNPVHVYNTAGNFSVSLVAFNSNGCSDTITYKDFVQTGPPEIDSLVDLPYRGCAPSSVNFKSIIKSAEPITAYLWEFGDGTTSALAEPSHLYQNTGSYNVKLTVTSAGGCQTARTFNSAVELGSVPQSKFSARPLATCASKSVSFFDESSGKVNEWLWFFGDGGSSTDKNPSHQYKDTGYFDITLIAKNNNCADTMIIENYINIFPPVAKFTVKLDCKLPFIRTFVDKSIGAKTWEWNFGDGTTSNEPSPSHTYTATGRYGVSLRVTNDDCEFITNDSVFVVDELPSFMYTPVNKALCKYDSITFTALNYHTDAISSFLWNYGDGKNDSVGAEQPVISHQFKTVGAFNPFLIATDINGCKDTVNQKLKIDVYGPTAAFSNAAGTCVNTTVKFNDNSISDGIHPIVNWRWEYGDGTNLQQTKATSEHAYANSGFFNVKLSITDSYGCVDSILKNRAVTITRPVAKFSESDTLTCSKNVIEFKSLSSGSSLTYSWNFGDGKTSTVVKPTHNYINAGVYTVKLIVVDRYGCTDSLIKVNDITISNPVASFILNDTVGLCPPLLIEPKNTSKNYNSLFWDFGDSSNTILANPQHYYGTPGTYELKLIVKGYGQCYDTATKKIRLKGPSGTLNYSKLTGCVPTDITFSSVAKNVVEFVWDFNNGVVKHTKEPSIDYNYTSYGSYLPKLVLIDSAGCRVSVENKDRIVISDITAGIKQLKDVTKVYCDSSLFVFNDSSKAYYDEIKSYKWNFGDNQTHSSKNPTHYYNKSGVYNVTLTVESKIGCTSSVLVPVNVAVNKSPRVAMSVVDSVCETSAVKFYASNLETTNASVTWKWSFGDGNYDTKQNAIHTYAAGGNYTAGVLATASNGCTGVKSMPVTIYANPRSNAGSDTMVCYGNAVTLKASGAPNFTWKADPSLSCTTCANPVAKPDTTTWYFATGASSYGCKSSDSVLVKVYKPFKISAKNNNVLCLGQSITLNATGSEQYQWIPQTYLDNPYSATPVFRSTAPTNITYTVIGKDSKNCFSDTSKVSVKVYPMPSIEMVEKSIVANAGIPVKLNTISSPDITQWKWSPSMGLDSPFAASPSATPKNNTTYQVVATNEGNCSTSAEVTLSVLCDGRNIFIPNTFSPNGDGMNDVFFPRGKGIFNIKSLRIFNRWGSVVFEKMNFSANSASEGWDGTYQGKKQSLDVYVYMLEVVCDNGTVNRINGNVTLLK